MTETASRLPATRSYWAGALLALLAGTMWSFGGITVRYAPDSDPWQYLIWRSVGLFVAVEAWSLIQGRGTLTRSKLAASVVARAQCAASSSWASVP